ncbi:MAG TPA: glycoside hydrolase family 3 N-terminal domain-containing protein [Gemmatimonadales bacterium]|jgi:beta-N-acetylhexosaminidase
MHRSLISVGLALLIASCGHPAPKTAPEPQAPAPALRPLPLPADEARVRHLLDSLSLRDKIAQLVMPWITGGYEPIDGTEMKQALTWVDSLHVGGIIMSVGTPTEIAAKLNALQRAAPLPLLVASDLEGGTTLRFVGGTPFPTQMGVGAGGREDDAYQMGRITALEGRAVGIHLAFAPVADVNSNPDNPIINTRSFGGDPKMVARFVAATIRGIRDNGMFATAKHFPGHGDTETDSHLSLPTITAGWSRFDTLELVPFRAAIAAGVDAVMSAHIALPALDPGQHRPGTLAPPILTGILRDSLHFNGLVTTDALNMGAIVKEVGADEAPVLAFLAGSDLLLMPSDAGRAIDAMVRAVNSGRIPMTRVNESVRRVLEMKARLGLFEQREVDLDHVSSVVDQAEFRAIGEAVTQRSITLLKDSLGMVDRTRAAAETICLLSMADNGVTLGTTLATELRRKGFTVRSVTLPLLADSATRDSVLRIVDQSTPVIIAAAVKVTSGKGTIALPDAAAQVIDSIAARHPTLLISFGSPYLISQVPSVSAYILAWTANPTTELAVARALTGQAPITGKSPILIPPAWPIGTGLQRGGP